MDATAARSKMRIADSPVIPNTARALAAKSGGHRLSQWVRRHNTLLTVAAACVTPILYLAFVLHYSVNSFEDDDWSVVPAVHAALHGQLTLQLLWSQHNESRLLIGNLVEVLFGLADRLDLRSVIIFSAAVFIASYGELLVLVRRYFHERLTPLPVLVIGLVWFSLADIQNALWAFQVSWYLTVCFFLLMLCALLVPESLRKLWFAVAVVAAIAASLSTVQGFLCWPVGLIFLLWQRQSRRTQPVVIWLGAMLVSVAVYLNGYSFNAGNTCAIQSSCTIGAEFHHPITSLGFFFALLGSVIPGEATGVLVYKVSDPARFVMLGVVLFAAAIFILVQSWRYRASKERLPLPALMIVFSLLYDLTITSGRSGLGAAGAVNDNRFVMANLVLLTGIVIYGLVRIPRRLVPSRRDQHLFWTYLGICALALFLAVQVTTATRFGIANGRESSSLRTLEARYFLTYESDLASYSHMSPECQQAFLFLKEPAAILHDASEDQLGEFHISHQMLLKLQPVLPSACREHGAAPKGDET
jgi:hypothetical protein